MPQVQIDSTRALTVKWRNHCEEVASLKDARLAWIAFRNASFEGAGALGDARVVQGRKKIARISYNGRVWVGRKFDKELVVDDYESAAELFAPENEDNLRTAHLATVEDAVAEYFKTLSVAIGRTSVATADDVRRYEERFGREAFRSACDAHIECLRLAISLDRQ